MAFFSSKKFIHRPIHLHVYVRMMLVKYCHIIHVTLGICSKPRPMCVCVCVCRGGGCCNECSHTPPPPIWKWGPFFLGGGGEVSADQEEHLCLEATKKKSYSFCAPLSENLCVQAWNLFTCIRHELTVLDDPSSIG